MKSLNFEFLRPQFPEMAELSAFAESYIHSDPSSACVKLRAFAELLTSALYARYRFPRPQENEFVALLNSPEFRKAVPAGVQNALHGMRKEGNQAAHGGNVSAQRAAELLFDAFKLSNTNCVILRNLMENGIRDATGQRLGKTQLSAFPVLVPPFEAQEQYSRAVNSTETLLTDLESTLAASESFSRVLSQHAFRDGL